MVAGKHDIVLGQTCPDGTLLSMCVNVELDVCDWVLGLDVPRLAFIGAAWSGVAG
jgi:hypothetical protein